jgi:hypothetical protein
VSVLIVPTTLQQNCPSPPPAVISWGQGTKP